MRDGRGGWGEDETQTDTSNSQSGLLPSLACPIPQPLIALTVPQILCSLVEC